MSNDKEFVDTNSLFVPRACLGSSTLDLKRQAGLKLADRADKIGPIT